MVCTDPEPGKISGIVTTVDKPAQLETTTAEERMLLSSFGHMRSVKPSVASDCTDSNGAASVLPP